METFSFSISFLVFLYCFIFISFHFFSLCDGDLSVIVHCYLLGNMCDGDGFDSSQIWPSD